MTIQERIEAIRQRWLKFEYGLGQSDHDIRFLLTQLEGRDPNYVEVKHTCEHPDCKGFKE